MSPFCCCDDDRLPDAGVWRGGRAARGGAGVRHRSVPHDRGSVARPGDSHPVLRRGRRGGRHPRVRRSRPLDGILVVGDRPTVIGARVAQALGLPGHPAEAAAIARNKQRTRERFRAAGLPVPWFVATTIAADPRDVARVDPVSGGRQAGGAVGQPRRDACRRPGRVCRGLRPTAARCCSRRTSGPSAATRMTSVLVEGFIPGREYALEGLLHHGVLHVLALFDKPDPLDGPFFEETIYVTPSAARAARAGGDRRGRDASRRRRSGWRTARSTPSVASTRRACSCSRSPRVRSAACARARCGSNRTGGSHRLRRPDLAGRAAAAPCAG